LSKELFLHAHLISLVTRSFAFGKDAGQEPHEIENTSQFSVTFDSSYSSTP